MMDGSHGRRIRRLPVQVIAGDKVIHTLHPGEFCGEIALLKKRVRTHRGPSALTMSD